MLPYGLPLASLRLSTSHLQSRTRIPFTALTLQRYAAILPPAAQRHPVVRLLTFGLFQHTTNKSRQTQIPPQNPSAAVPQTFTTPLGNPLGSPTSIKTTGAHSHHPSSVSMAPRNNPPRAAPRGPAARRARADRDGDISMGMAVKGRAGVSKVSVPSSGSRSDRGVGGMSNGGILRPTAHREILRKAAAGDVPMKEARVGGATRGGVTELKVTGWQKSKASGDSDGGVSALIKWLEKKASTKLGSRGKNCRVKKVCC